MVLEWMLPLPVPALDFSRFLAFGMVLAGLALGVWAVARMLSRHTPVSPGKPATALVTDGPFRFTRNPIYFGFLLVFLGFTLIMGSLWGLILAPLIPLIVNHLVIRPEETYLAARFAERYHEYKSRVRKWI